MADEQTNQPSRADDYRKAVDDYKEFRQQQLKDVRDAGLEEIEFGIQYITGALWSIAAELAEMNSRDREAEIRAKNAEAFVVGIQEQLRRQGIVMSASMPNMKPPRGK